jgi:hypothetical protein
MSAALREAFGARMEAAGLRWDPERRGWVSATHLVRLEELEGRPRVAVGLVGADPADALVFDLDDLFSGGPLLARAAAAVEEALAAPDAGPGSPSPSQVSRNFR